VAHLPVRTLEVASREHGVTKTTADFMLERLSAWAVEKVCGYPGDGIKTPPPGR